MGDRPWQDPDVLRELYQEKEMSQPEIAEKLDCSRWTVRKWLDRHDIQTRDFMEGREIKNRKDPDVRFDLYDGGYERIRHQYKNEEYQVRVNRLVALIDHPPEELKGKHVHHKNRIPWDNRPENLEVIEPGEHQTMHLLEDRYSD